MKKYLTLSNGIFGLSIAFALGVLLKIYLDRSALPPGVCPTNYNNHLIYASIILLIVGTIVTSLLDRNKKISANKDHHNIKDHMDD